MNPGWNAGGRSVETLAEDWTGVIEFDVPDSSGAIPGGVAAGLVAASRAPSTTRTGYSHLKYGLVFTAGALRIIHDGATALQLPRGDIVSARIKPSADSVAAQLDGETIAWQVNGAILFSGPFSMPGQFVLDTTLYLTFDAVENPAFKAGESLGLSSLNGVIAPLQMEANGAMPAELVGALPALRFTLSELPVSELHAVLRGLAMDSGVGASLGGAFGRLAMVASSGARYASISASLGRLEADIAMEPVDPTISYCTLVPVFPRFQMTATTPTVARIEAALVSMVMAGSSESTYAEMTGGLRSLRVQAYGGEMTPLVRVPEILMTTSVIDYAASIGVAVSEVATGSTSMMVMATVTADGTEEVSIQEIAEVTQTLLNSIAEQLAVGERVSAFARAVGGGVAPGEGNAWAVNADSSASSRYEGYDFDSFAAVKGKHFGARRDGVYLLEGEDDAGVDITSGISLGKHDFGTKALKHMDAIYAGVSSTGALFMRVGDGVNAYTYRARRNDQHLRTQRFDVGRGLRANYFTLDLTSDADAFELDSVTFHILPTSRRI